MDTVKPSCRRPSPSDKPPQHGKRSAPPRQHLSKRPNKTNFRKLNPAFFLLLFWGAGGFGVLLRYRTLAEVTGALLVKAARLKGVNMMVSRPR